MLFLCQQSIYCTAPLYAKALWYPTMGINTQNWSAYSLLDKHTGRNSKINVSENLQTSLLYEIEVVMSQRQMPNNFWRFTFLVGSEQNVWKQPKMFSLLSMRHWAANILYADIHADGDFVEFNNSYFKSCCHHLYFIII